MHTVGPRAMSRLSVMGELTALLADEITQPVATALNNARAALHFLDRSPPDLSEVREALECIVADADRATDIIDRVRDQIKKAPPRDKSGRVLLWVYSKGQRYREPQAPD